MTEGTTTPSISFGLLGINFTADAPYKEGHVCNAAEASQLNRVRVENIGNNLRGKLKTLMDAPDGEGSEPWTAEHVNADPEKHAIMQTMITEYAATYVMGERSGGGAAPKDPVLVEAYAIATPIIHAAIKAAGYKVTDYKVNEVRDMCDGLFEQDPSIMEKARANVENRKGVAADNLASLVAAPKAAEEEVSEAE